MKVTEPLIKLCLAELTKQAAAKQRYKDYYDGRHAILTDYAMQDSHLTKKIIISIPGITRRNPNIESSNISPKGVQI